MAKMNKSLLIGIATAAVSLSGLGMAAAHAAGTTSGNPMSSLVQAIATKFNLNPSDVQAVVTAQRSQMSANRQASYKTRLDSAVTAGTITQAQENLILAEQTSQQTFMASLKGMTQTQRQAAMKANQANLKAWATTNSIPQKFIPGGFGGRGMGGHRFGNASATPAATPAP